MLPKDQQRSSTEERTTTATTAATAPEGEAAASSPSDEELLGLGAPTCWKAASSSASSALTYWKLDEHPTPQDGQRRALDWVRAARAVAGRVTREEVDREMMMMKD